MENQMENIADYCAQGTRRKEEMIPVSEQVSLRVITFKPPEPSSNPPVVFVPGWITLMEAWKDVLREMTKDFTIHYIETREKISSSVKGKVPYTVDALGQDVIDFVSRLGFKDHGYVLFGSSLGATVLLDCSMKITQKPKCLVLVGPNAVFRMPFFGRFFIHMVYPPAYGMIKWFVKWYLRTFRLNVKNDYAQYKKYCNNLNAADPWKLKRAALEFSKYEVWNLLPEIILPTLIIGASKDKLHEPENLKRMVSLLPNVQYIDLETNKGTHSPEMVQAVRRYLSDR